MSEKEASVDPRSIVAIHLPDLAGRVEELQSSVHLLGHRFLERLKDLRYHIELCDV